jgi:hypothetical protein
MPPILHALLGFLVSALGMATLATLGGIFYEAGGREFLGLHSFPFLVLVGGAAGFFSVLAIWNRYVPIRCPWCGGRMTMAYQGRQQMFDCTVCGRRR